MSGESMLNSLSVAPVKAAGTIHFTGVGEAGMSVWIGGVQYLEANVANAAQGVWTNGAAVADSRNSLLAAINGDTRANAPRVTAVANAAAANDGIIVVADEIGPEFNYALTTDSAANATVGNMIGGFDGRREAFIVAHTVNARDVLVDEITLGLNFVPALEPVVWFVDATGAFRVPQPTGLALVAATPRRLRYIFAGATDPVATNVMYALCYRAS